MSADLPRPPHTERLRRAAGNDAAAHESFRQLVLGFADSPVRYAQAILRGRPDLVPDAVQEMWVAVHGQRTSLPEGRRFIPWALTILRNQCLKLLRFRIGSLPEEGPRSRADGPVTRVLGRERDERLEAALDALEDGPRQALELHVMDKLTFEETAEALGVNARTVKRWVPDALARLRAALECDAAPAAT